MTYPRVKSYGGGVVDYLSRARLKDKAGDWIWAQAQYEAGIALVQDIAIDIGVSPATLSNRAQRLHWVRDPHARALIVAEVKARDAERHRALLAAEKEKIVQVTAVMQSKVLVGHRKDIQQARRLVTSLLTELETITKDLPEFKDLGELMHEPDERGVDKLNTMYRRILSLPERSATLNSIGQALKTFIQLERQAYSISGAIEDPDQPRAPEEVTKGLADIMEKFDSVLALQAPPPVPEPPAEVIIDVSSTDKAAVT